MNTITKLRPIVTVALAALAAGGAMLLLATATVGNAAPLQRRTASPARDATSTLTIRDASVTEGNSGTTDAIFTVTLSPGSSETVTVNFDTADGTATTADNDYAAASGTLTFDPGDMTHTLTVTVNGDTKNEANETFFVNLSNPSNATITDSQGRGTILNDDAQPSLSINNVSVTEGNSSTTNAVFTVTLSAVSGQVVTVQYATANGTATTANNDYATASGTLTFNPGQTTRTLTVTVYANTVYEADETFFVNLSGATNATIADLQGQGTILNDDPAPTIQFSNANYSVNETVSSVTITATLTGSTAVTATVNYAASNGTATAGNDYFAASGTLTFVPGIIRTTFSVTIIDDTFYEGNETVNLTLSDPVHATLGTTNPATLTIVDNEGPPASIVVQVVPNKLIANSNATAAITAIVRDNDGDPLAGIVLSGSTLPSTRGSVTGLGTTNNNGLAYGTWTATAGSTTVGGGTLRVTNNINIISGTAPITLTAGLPYFVTLLPDVPSTVVTATYVGLTALVEDQFHNSVTNGTVVTFATSLGDILFPQRTTISGLAFSGLRSTRVGTAHITATSGTASDIATVVFTPDVPYTITVQVFPLSLVANSGATAAITATISDRYDNPLNGQVLTGSFSIPTMGTITGLGVTNVAGQVFGTWKAGSALGHALLRVSNRHITGTLEVSLIGTAPTTITVQVSPSILIANSNMTGTITATVVDTYGNPLPNVGLSGSTSPPTLGSVGAFDFTDSDGRASSTWTASPGSAVGSGLLRVSYSGAVSNTVAITLIYSTPTTVTLAVNPRTLVARSSATATITATVTDRYYNRVPNVPLSITITPATVGHVSWSGSSNVNGLVTGTWTAGTVPGTGQLQGGSLSITGVTTVTLDPMRTYLPLAMKNFPPIPFGQWVIINTAEDEYTYQPTVTLQLAANVLGDNIESVQLSNDNVHWSNWLAFAPTMIWTLDSTNGLKTVYAKFSGHMGGVSGVASDDIFLFKNGDFSQNLANWNLDPSSKLSVTVSISDPSRLGNPAGLLGNPAYACTSVPIGYASLSQSFIMPKVPSGKQLHLLFSYHVFTYDQQNDPMDDRHDRFEVLTNTFLVMRDMNQSPPYGCPPTTPIHIIGPKDASLVIKGNPGDSINVDFRLYNDWDNQYNTYVYLDDVRLQFQ